MDRGRSDRENRLTAAMGEGLGDWVKQVKALRSTDGWLQNSHADVDYSTGNIVSNTVITMLGARWKYGGDRFVSYKNI